MRHLRIRLVANFAFECNPSDKSACRKGFNGNSQVCAITKLRLTYVKSSILCFTEGPEKNLALSISMNPIYGEHTI